MMHGPINNRLTVDDNFTKSLNKRSFILFGRGVTSFRKLSQAADKISGGHRLLIAAVMFIRILVADLQLTTLHYRPVVSKRRSDCVCIDSKIVFYWTVTLTQQNEKHFSLQSKRNKDSSFLAWDDKMDK